MKKPVLMIFVLTFLTITLALIKIFIANNVATSGIILSQVQNDIDRYKIENSELATKVYTLSSLTYISSKAEEMGYQNSSEAFVLTNQRSVALKQ